ncbi:hypothetical protein GCS56_000035 [Vibrio metschnikovii]|uniref:hypothetical protein n=1 Tax=Vibrio metschnikovii TaxID=28172 RepID=UPI00165DF8C6|nr:hypothetical protein [Vibrio metschnikovii]EKO3922818.1 hypothetical protein [Vibrio metschnikovii]
MSNTSITVPRTTLVEMLKDEGFPVDQIPNFLAAFTELEVEGEGLVQIDFERAMLSNLNYSKQKLTSHLFLLGWWCFWVVTFNQTTVNHTHFQAAGAIRSLTFLASCTSDRKLAKRMAAWWEECQPVIGTILEEF